MHNGQVQTLGALFFWNVERFQTTPLLSWERNDGMLSYSSSEFETAVLKLAKWLGSLPLSQGDRVALYVENRPEWHLVDFACHLARLVVVPVYPTLAAHQMGHILQHCGAKVIFCGSEQLERVALIRRDVPELSRVIAMDRDGRTESLPTILETAPAATTEERSAFRERALAEDPDSIATIVYTSGTTGTPKGVMLSHRNIIFDSASSLKRLPERPVRLALCVLPLSHVLERMLSYSYLFRGIPIAYGDPHDLKELLPLHRPTVMGAVPRILEKIRESIEAKIATMPAHRRKISSFLLKVGYDRLDKRPTLRRRLHPIADALMFRKIRRELGGIEAFICGGAWLNPELERYFQALGFIVVQGYGLTETAPVITCNEYGRERPGSVGPPIEGVEVKIDAEGEILTRGANVMKGYFRDPEATAKAFRDGWFATGDFGRLDADGYLTITGRRKEMLVLSNGKNIYYAPIEQALAKCSYIEQAFFVGEGRNYATVMIVPNRASLLQYASERGMVLSSDEELLCSPAVLELFRQSVESFQAEFSRFEQAKRFCFLPEAALQDLELVTPTQKVRRNVLERKYASDIDRMYRQDVPFVVSPSILEPATIGR